MKKDVLIYKITDMQITNDKTGEVTDYKVVNYLTKIGNDFESLQCYVKTKFSSVIEKYKMKQVSAEFEEKVINNSIKLYLKTVNNEICR